MTTRQLRYVVAVAAAAALLYTALPATSGATWAATLARLTAITAPALLLLGAIWLVGLLAHTITLTGALPGLSHRRALTLSLTGSAVANLLPLGGAAGVAVNYRMVRAWGFDRPAFSAYTLVTNVWDVLAKLALLPIAFVVVLVAPQVGFGPLLGVAAGASSVLLLVLPLLAWTLLTPHGAHIAGAWADRTSSRILRLVGSSRSLEVQDALVRVQADCGTLVRRSWRRLTLGMALYTTSLVVLLWLCLHVAGAAIPAFAVVVGFAVERLLTLAGLTPGGVGLVEVGLATALLLYGGVPAAVVTGILLYRVFTFGIEIPVGGAWLLAWFWMRGRRTARLAA